MCCGKTTGGVVKKATPPTYYGGDKKHMCVGAAKTEGGFSQDSTRGVPPSFGKKNQRRFGSQRAHSVKGIHMWAATKRVLLFGQRGLPSDEKIVGFPPTHDGI